ncbi:hypothetical protein [Falsigemmobacter faecalis]|uniref:Uncharacterized protein n=1 Tax=Falsigemmobacter faecalis TaxID=2488730 RepID=A0A3P3DR23_9RHOB|nr:hypothetical protein [Falsigemmobacter faecalis]RRH76669.1 hypothetical protein EG244_05745 [Falsigemmobacter faecalis]
MTVMPAVSLSLLVLALLAFGLLRRRRLHLRPAPAPLWSVPPGQAYGLRPPGSLRQERVLRTSAGMRRLIVLLSLSLLLSLSALQDLQQSLLFWTAAVLLAVVIWQSLAAQTWELRFDQLGLSWPAGPAGRREGRMWRELSGLSRDDPLSLVLHFADGSALVIPKHIEGRGELLQIAEHWIAAAQGSASDAGTSRS